ncbi:MAG: YjbH domain-containing protein [Gammaproteobacteria bacterium]
MRRAPLLRTLQGWLRQVAYVLLTLSLSSQIYAAPNLMGQTGLIAMPDGRIDPDGTWRVGVSNSSPYLTGWTSVSILPRLEFSARYTRLKNVPAFGANSHFGSYKDKSFDLKLLLRNESAYVPALSVGAQDFLGTRLFAAHYLAMSKRFGPIDASVGAGNGRIGGLFGGLRYTPTAYRNLSLVAEYDATKYGQDFSSSVSGAAERKKGLSFGIEYQAFGWLHTQLSRQGHTTGLMAYISVPLNRKEYVPKLDEPAPYAKVTPRPKLQRWLNDPSASRNLIAELERQDFKNIEVTSTGTTVNVTLTNTRISLMSRAVGRAARTILLLTPDEIREIRITYTETDLPVATYTFFDLAKLRDYFANKISRKVLANYVSIEYAAVATGPAISIADDTAASRDIPVESTTVRQVTYNDDEGDIVSYRQEDSLLNRVKVAPKLAIFFNDPSGFLHYQLFLRANYEKHLADKLYLLASMDGTLLEDVSKVTQPSNSVLPHVRTDVADYMKDSKLKLNQLLLNKYYHPASGVYGRASAGFYETMYAGTGGQILYASESGQWAADLTVDWLKQRDTYGGFGFRPYATVTALGALHYRLPLGVTGTVRAGRFLAKDIGARFEMKRRFASGFEMGAWYTITNGNDITTPGSPTKPYHDKGIFLTMSLDALLTKDTQGKGSFSLAPWTRDVGQLVASPGDLYDEMEKPLFLDLHNRDGLVRLGDRNDDYAMPSSGPTLFDRPWLDNAHSDLSNAYHALSSDGAWRALSLGLGVTALSAVLDKPVDDWAKRHNEGRFAAKVVTLGNALPVVGLAVSGVLALDSSDARLNNTAYIALQAGAAAGVAGEVSKWLVGRSRPQDKVGSADFHPFKSGGSFPSVHSAVIWATVTPYAQEYDMPWLYGVAALTNLGRVVGRAHWLSDTVGGSLLGYATGSLLWHWQRDLDGHSPRVSLDTQSVTLSWATR